SAAHEVREPAIAGQAALERKAQPVGGRTGSRQKRGIICLRQIDEPPVVAEDLVAQLGIAVEPHAAHDQPVEMPDEIIREEEGAELLVQQPVEFLLPGKEGVAVRTFDPFHPCLGTDPVYAAAGATIGIEDEDRREALLPGKAAALAQAVGNAV